MAAFTVLLHRSLLTMLHLRLRYLILTHLHARQVPVYPLWKTFAGRQRH